MKLISLNKYISLLILFLCFNQLNAEEEIDIWNKDKIKDNEVEKNIENNETNFKSKIDINSTFESNIEIENNISQNSQEVKIFGILDPEENNFNLNMWSTSDAEDVRSSIKRINKIQLSNTATQIFENTILSIAYPPRGMENEEFVSLKTKWMIDNKRVDLIEKFLKQNKTFPSKKKLIQYLVDSNIAKANIKEGCNKINFLDKDLKDRYLEKFKIYCLVFNKKKNEAQLQLDILREENQSDKFFDDKINFLLGVTDKTSSKIREDSLLNFYLSSVTISNFSYEPKTKTKKIIWEYLNAANLIQLEDNRDKEKLKNLEFAANQDQFDKKKIFDIYSRISFDLNTLIKAEDVYQTFDSIDARALIYQKFLLSDNEENKIKLLILLKDLFKKDKISNIFTRELSDRLKEIDMDNVSESYSEVVNKNIIIEEEFNQGKIKFDDKILHRSKLIRYFRDEIDQKRAQKDLFKIYKKIKKNRKYFFSAKDLALVESLASDGFEIPKELNYKEISKQYNIPSNLLKLSTTEESAFLTLKLVEIIGEDEAYDLDPETIYFIIHLLNQNNLKKIRNEILISALPERT
ncbi:MAG: hypothetical protein CMJ01_01865 [Pelagibacteraceae bacterium]|nr:hypothetical protein [Pelagibacteraceae bacterium]|tara:strand:+ start:17498 stop:19231 length:1734 start_codon:yes stop_codon:yes gene_type:complete